MKKSIPSSTQGISPDLFSARIREQLLELGNFRDMLKNALLQFENENGQEGTLARLVKILPIYAKLVRLEHYLIKKLPQEDTDIESGDKELSEEGWEMIARALDARNQAALFQPDEKIALKNRPGSKNTPG